MQNIIILPLNESNLEQCANCCKTATESWNKEQIEQSLKSGTSKIYIAIDNSTVVGMAIFQLALDEASLNNITVLPQNRGCGIGEYLLFECIKMLASGGTKQVFLEVRSENKAAIGLYTKLNFVKIGERKAFYKNPQDNAIVMKLDI